MTLNLKTVLGMSLKSLQKNKIRSFLAAFGILIAVAGIVMVGVIGENAKTLIYQEINSFGFNTVWMFRQHSYTKAQPSASQSSGLRYYDLLPLKTQIKGIGFLSPVVEDQTFVQSNHAQRLSRLYYVNSDFYKIENDRLILGRFFNDLDLKSFNKVCVVDANWAKKAFPNRNPLGQWLFIKGHYYQVIGLVAAKERSLLKSIGIGVSDLNRVFLPITIALQEKGPEVDYIQFSALNSSLVLPTAKALKAFLESRSNPLRYTYVSMKSYLDSANKIMDLITKIVLICLSITLVVGAMGIANIMSVSVMERIKEIGIRKAVGASSGAIFSQFLCEAIVLSASAAFTGLFLGSLAACLILIFFFDHWFFPLIYWLFGLCSALLVGVLAGLVPAYWAAKQDPAVVLRYE